MANRAEVARVWSRLWRDGEAFRDRIVLVDGPPADTYAHSVPIARLVEDQGLVDALIDGSLRRIEEATGHRVPRHVAATRVLHDYAWPACVLLASPWFFDGTLPVLQDDGIRIDPTSGMLVVTAPGGVLANAGPDDVRRAVADHHAPLLEALGPVLRRGPRAVWGTVADDLVSALWWLGRLVGDEAAGVASAAEVLPSPQAPFPGAADFRSLVADDGGRHLIRTRVACCLRYRFEADACGTCPRITDDERRSRLVGC